MTNLPGDERLAKAIFLGYTKAGKHWRVVLAMRLGENEVKDEMFALICYLDHEGGNFEIRQCTVGDVKRYVENMKLDEATACFDFTIYASREAFPSVQCPICEEYEFSVERRYESSVYKDECCRRCYGIAVSNANGREVAKPLVDDGTCRHVDCPPGTVHNDISHFDWGKDDAERR